MVNYFDLNGSIPKKIFICDTSPPEWATRKYSVIAYYGWAQRILCSNCYRADAESIAAILGERLGIPVEV